jgi:hypothetical protein
MKKHEKKCAFLIIACFVIVGCGNNPSGVNLDVLRSYPDYNNEDTSSLPVFTYADASDPDLVRLRETYHLEAVAGNGDELSQIINLMKWVHNTVPHNGNAENPSSVNALNILRLATEENRSVNCRMIAIVLNEVYLSLGFRSRYVTGMPKSENFHDCHVINAVYSETRRKWIYMDASFEGYFMDDAGNFLGIQEVRERLLQGFSLRTNENVNRNGKPFHDYIGYMTKNLFRLSCSVASEFNYESQTTEIQFIELVPAGYRMDLTPVQGISNSGGPITTYYTSNPSFFWSM